MENENMCYIVCIKDKKKTLCVCYDTFKFTIILTEWRKQIGSAKYMDIKLNIWY